MPTSQTPSHAFVETWIFTFPNPTFLILCHRECAMHAVASAISYFLLSYILTYLSSEPSIRVEGEDPRLVAPSRCIRDKERRAKRRISARIQLS